MDDLNDRFRVRAVNLFGYGETSAWPADRTQTLDDQARLVEAALPPDAEEIYLVGHSFGGAVAMKTAARLQGRVAKLVLLEANPFGLLAQTGQSDAFAEVMDLRDCIKKFGERGERATAAERFADYWIGAGAWRNMPPERRAAFAACVKPNYFEWDTMISETTSPEQWASLLPKETLLVCDRHTVRPIREIAAILRRLCPSWTYEEIDAGGHMAPVTHPEVVNPIVARFLDARMRPPLALSRDGPDDR